VGKSYFADSISITGDKYEIVPTLPVEVFDKPQTGDLVFNEILFNAGDAQEEFVELYNKTDKTLDISGLRITIRKSDGSLSTGNSIPAKSTISPRACLALCKSPSVDSLYYACPKEANFLSMSVPALSNEGATVVLCNVAKDTIFDELRYNPDWHHPLIQNQQGVSLERINPESPTQSAESWHSAASTVHYATPGYRNSQYTEINSSESTKAFWLEDESFSPDNDGNDDLLLIHYRFSEAGWMGNICIFDAQGKRVNSLCKNQLLSTEGTLTWDGRRDDNSLANLGLYVIYAELFNNALGKTKREKMVCVMNAKK
jgi:hypothetical protein